VEVGLFEEQVDLGAFCLGSWEEGAENLSPEAFRNVVIELNFGIEGVGVVPGIS
jgi:hypothetical protein